MVGTGLTALLLLIASPQAAAAQTVRGLMIDSVSRAPLAGAFLTLIDDKGVERARAMTNAAGEYALTAPATGTYRVRSKRIGFRPLISKPFPLGPGIMIAFNAAIDPIPIALQEVVVAGERQCDIDAGASVAAIWDEIREALAAVSWTSRVPSYWYETTVFVRDVSVSGRQRIPDSTWHEAGVQKLPFRNYATEAELDRQGYVVVTDSGWLYRAPDADVLLTNTFLRTHCFEIRKGRGDSDGLIGLGFNSARDRKVPDINGTLWVDRQTAELRRMEFNYVRLPDDVVASGAGGRIEFMRLPNGAWIVRDWVIRMPYTKLKQQIMAMGERVEVTGFREKGGSADFIRAHDGKVVYGTPSVPVVALAPPTPTPPLAARPVATQVATSSVDSTPPSPAQPPPPPQEPVVEVRRRPAVGTSNVLKADEFERTTALDALALIQQFRPNWLHSRGAVSIMDPTAGDIDVYYNGVQAGNIQRLREIAVQDLRELRFLNAGEAQMRYGLGHAAGVIEVWTR